MANERITTNFDAIGVHISDDAEMDAFNLLIDDLAKEEETRHGNYALVKDDHGCEIWLGLTDDALVTMNPIFTKTAPIVAEIVGLVPQDDYTEFECVLVLRTEDEGGVESRIHAHIVNAPELIGMRKETRFLGFSKKTPVTVIEELNAQQLVSLCVFSLEIELFKDEATYDAKLSAPSTEINDDCEPSFLDDLAVGAQIPVGAFDDGSPDSIGTGLVLECGTETGLSGGTFCWATISNVVGTINVVWPHSEQNTPEIGNVLTFGGRVMGKLINPNYLDQKSIH